MLFLLVNSYQLTQRNILNTRYYRTVTDFSTNLCPVKVFDIILSHGRDNVGCLYRHIYQLPNLPSMEETLKYRFFYPEETLHMKISIDQKTKRQMIKQGQYSSTINYRTNIPETFDGRFGYFTVFLNVSILNLFINRLYNVSTSSCANLKSILSSSSSCLCHSSLLPLIPSVQVSLGLHLPHDL